MKKNLCIILIAIIGISISGCKKYDDGPAFSFSSVKGRLVRTWVLEKQYINTIEQTLDADDKMETVAINDDGTYTATSYINGNPIEVNGTWVLDDNDENVTCTYTAILTFTTTYKILRLTSKELWYEHTSSSNTIEDHLTAK